VWVVVVVVYYICGVVWYPTWGCWRCGVA